MFLIRSYRLLLRVTKRRGLFTLARLHTRLFSKGQIVDLPSGAELFIPSDSHFFGFVLGTHEEHVANLLTQHIKSGDVCVDVGANIGYFSAIFARLAGPHGQVHSFEPVPENFSTLTINAKRAAEAGLRILPQQCAVSSKRGELRIVRKEWSTYHEVAEVGKDASANVERIPSIPLDEARNAWSNLPISFLKVDVEGHELPVVQGMHKILKEGGVARMVIEITPGADAGRIEELLSPYARNIQLWLDGAWRKGAISSLATRTDVFIEFAA